MKRFLILIVSGHAFGSDLCSTDKNFVPQWNPVSKTCVLALNIEFPEKKYDLLMDFNRKIIFVGNKTNAKDSDYGSMSSYSFITFTKAHPSSNIAENYSYTWNNVSKEFEKKFISDRLHRYLNVFPVGVTSLTKEIPATTAGGKMYSISEEKNTCNQKTKNYLVVKMNGDTRYLIDPEYIYPTDLKKISSKKKCDDLSNNEVPKPPEAVPSQSLPSQK